MLMSRSSSVATILKLRRSSPERAPSLILACYARLVLAFQELDLLGALAPGRYDCRVAAVAPGWWWGECFDRATGHAGWLLARSPQEAAFLLYDWSLACMHARAVNPYEPRWKPEGKLTPAQREVQRRRRKQWKKEQAERGPHVEQEQKIRELVARGALFAVSHSGGKDSQAQLIQVRKVVPDEQLLVIHAPLKHVEWEGALEQARAQTPAGVPFVLAQAVDAQGDEKWLLEWVLDRGKWPSIGQRWCTSDWKTGPIKRDVKAYADANGYTIIVEALGLRAQESDRRNERPAFRPIPKEHGKRSAKLKQTREWYEWLPIKWMSTDEVFETIHAAGQAPLWTYQEGLSRASCAFCILASASDLRVAARLAPELYATYVAIERIVDEAHRAAGKGPHTIRQGKTLEETTGIPADPALVRKYTRAIRRTGDLSEVELPDVVPKPEPSERKRLRVLREAEVPQVAQMELAL